MPGIAKQRLSQINLQFRDNLQAFMEGAPEVRAQAKQRMITGVFSTLPPTMFVLIPLFAILLKLFYASRRRLYIEHLIVALHSHAFIFISLLLVTLASMAANWLSPHAAWTSYIFGWIELLLLVWIPVYLLIMQKRVYRQGWPMTLLKYWCIGWCYFWLLLLAVTFAAALGMAH